MISRLHKLRRAKALANRIQHLRQAVIPLLVVKRPRWVINRVAEILGKPTRVPDARNAIDIPEFVLASGERVTVLDNWPKILAEPSPCGRGGNRGANSLDNLSRSEG